MSAYLCRRLAYMVVVLLMVTFVAFGVIQLEPQSGDCLGELGGNKAIRKGFGLDSPLPVRYLMWIKNIFLHNLGYSCRYPGSTVAQVLFKGYWQWSLLLAGGALVSSWLIGILLGICSAAHRGSIRDHVTRFLSVFSIGTPVFLLALLAVWLLYLSPAVEKFDWGVGGIPSSTAGYLSRAVLAILVIALTQWAVLARYLRGHLLDVLSQPYVQAARAKGIPERRITYRHALRNALHPLISLMGFWLPSLFESTLAVGIIMQPPVVEFQLWKAIEHGDQYVILGGLLFLGGIVMAGNLLADLVLALADPRIRYE